MLKIEFFYSIYIGLGPLNMIPANVRSDEPLTNNGTPFVHFPQHLTQEGQKVITWIELLIKKNPNDQSSVTPWELTDWARCGKNGKTVIVGAFRSRGLMSGGGCRFYENIEVILVYGNYFMREEFGQTVMYHLAIGADWCIYLLRNLGEVSLSDLRDAYPGLFIDEELVCPGWHLPC